MTQTCTEEQEKNTTVPGSLTFTKVQFKCPTECARAATNCWFHYLLIFSLLIHESFALFGKMSENTKKLAQTCVYAKL